MTTTGPYFSRKPPRFVAQNRPNDCWAACLEMWVQGERGYSYSQDYYLSGAGDFDIGAGGIDSDALGSVIDGCLANGTLSMYWTKVGRAADVPYIYLILKEVGYVYVAFSRPGGGGHANVIFGGDGKTFDAVDPDSRIRSQTRPFSFYFSAFPAIVGWRMTSAMPGIDYTGRAPWDYAP
ncbi:MAG TPA: papain-like cysteine protease family protein [Caulobacteraceae bacterium]|nr:papain-like cysteine protease family protein [Caulobacteraceae bacterium]